jgi:hypothetical protein
LVDMNCFSLSFSWEVLISPLRFKYNFVGYSICGYLLSSLRVWIILLYAFLAFKVCADKFPMPLVCISAPSSTLWILRFGLLIVSQSSYMLYSCVLIYFFVVVYIQ